MDTFALNDHGSCQGTAKKLQMPIFKGNFKRNPEEEKAWWLVKHGLTSRQTNMIHWEIAEMPSVKWTHGSQYPLECSWI